MNYVSISKEGLTMGINEHSVVRLKDGRKAVILMCVDNPQCYIVEYEVDGDYLEDTISPEDIVEVTYKT